MTGQRYIKKKIELKKEKMNYDSSSHSKTKEKRIRKSDYRHRDSIFGACSVATARGND